MPYLDLFQRRDMVLPFIVMNDNTGESQIEMQIRKNVNKYTNIIIIPVI